MNSSAVATNRAKIRSDLEREAWPEMRPDLVEQLRDAGKTRKVMRGEVPTPHLQIEAPASGGDVALANHGDAPARLPRRLIARGPIGAADAVGAYRLQQGGEETVFTFQEGMWPWIEPGNRLVIGWITTRDSASTVTWEID